MTNCFLTSKGGARRAIGYKGARTVCSRHADPLHSLKRVTVLCSNLWQTHTHTDLKVTACRPRPVTCCITQ